MVEISTTHDTLILGVQGLHKLWAMKSRLDIPLEHLKAVYADPQPAMGWFQGMKLIGTDIPHIFRAGTFWQEGNKVFWDVRHPEKTIVLELEDEGFAKLIVEVEDPEASVQEIRQMIAGYQAAKTAAKIELEEFLQDPQPMETTSAVPPITPAVPEEDVAVLHQNS